MKMQNKFRRIYFNEIEYQDDIADIDVKYFTVPEVVKIKGLKNGLNIAELFHGPTLAFKDLALGVVGGLYNYFLEKSGKKCIVLVGKT